MAKEGGIRTAKGILFVLSRIAIAVVVVVLIVVAFYTAMHTMNVEVVVKDALSRRAQTALMTSGDAANQQMNERLFTNRFLANDTALNTTQYDNFEIMNYYQRTEIDPTVIWPWEEEATLRVTDVVTEITGVPLDTMTDDGTIIASSEAREKPPEWENGIYDLKVVKSGENAWKIDSMTLVRVVEPEETTTVTEGEESPSKTPDAQPSPSASETQAEESE